MANPNVKPDNGYSVTMSALFWVQQKFWMLLKNGANPIKK
jgi:hypothetical protein